MLLRDASWVQKESDWGRPPEYREYWRIVRRWLPRIKPHFLRAVSPRVIFAGMDVTHFLDAAAAGESKATAELLPLVYDKLRKPVAGWRRRYRSLV
jgi:hypothetical protein